MVAPPHLPQPRSRHRLTRSFGGAIALRHLLQEIPEISYKGLEIKMHFA